MTAGERDYINITEAAELIGVSRVTVWRWIRDGRLPALRLGHRTTRIQRADLDRFLARPRPAGEAVPEPPGPPAADERLEPRFGHLDALTDLAASLARAFVDGPPVASDAPERIAVASPRLRQLLTGLLDNAIQYGSASDPIDVAVSLAAPDVVELTALDRGLDLTPGQRVQNLERFYRDHGESRKNGLGLGQFISRQIVGLYGGEIRAEFPANGAARFVVRLPIETIETAKKTSPTR